MGGTAPWPTALRSWTRAVCAPRSARRRLFDGTLALSGYFCDQWHIPMLKADTHAIRVLIIEDSAGDARLLIEALQSSPSHYRFTLVRDGDEALDHLNRCDRQLL